MRNGFVVPYATEREFAELARLGVEVVEVNRRRLVQAATRRRRDLGRQLAGGIGLGQAGLVL